MTTNPNQTLWDVFTSKRMRVAAGLCVAGVAGVALMAWMLRLPLGISLVVAIFLGVWGVVGAVFETIIRAIVNARAPITITRQMPYEFVRHREGWINLAQVTAVRWCGKDVHIWQTDGEPPIKLCGDEAHQFATLLDDMADPLFAHEHPEE